MRLGISVLCLTAAGFLAGCGDDLNAYSNIPESDPRRTINRELRGYITPPSVLRLDNAGNLAWVQQAVNDYRPVLGDAAMPGKVKSLRAKGGCQFTPAADGSKVLGAQVSGGHRDALLPLFTYSSKDLNKRSEYLLDKEKQTFARRTRSERQDAYRQVDAIVTETSKPVHLVLQGYGNIVWNIVAHPDSTITGVSIVAGTAAGIANLDESVPVEVKNARQMYGCKATYARKPMDHWSFVKNAKESPSSHGEIMKQNVSEYRRYAAWFRKNFPKGTAGLNVGGLGAAHVLLGPMPETAEQRVPYKTVAGQTVHLLHERNVFAGTLNAYIKKHDDQLNAIVAKAKGGV